MLIDNRQCYIISECASLTINKIIECNQEGKIDNSENGWSDHFCENCIGKGCIDKEGFLFFEKTYKVGSQCYRAQKGRGNPIAGGRVHGFCLHPRNQSMCLLSGKIQEVPCDGNKRNYCDKPGNK